MAMFFKAFLLLLIVLAFVVSTCFIPVLIALLYVHLKKNEGFEIRDNADGTLKVVNNDGVSFGYKISKVRKALRWRFYSGLVYFDNTVMAEKGDTSWKVAKCNFDGGTFDFDTFEVVEER